MSATLRSSMAHAAGWSRRGGPYFPLPAGTLLVVWVALIGIAVVGSAMFGASLSLVLPQWNVWSSAAWLVLSAGLAWVVFIPALASVSRESFAVCFHVSLLTMAAGEAVLVAGAALNVALWLASVTAHAAVINYTTVAFSNVVMITVLATLLARRGVPAWKSIAVWLVALNGTGALLFLLFARLLS
ncbi:MAG: hypothetical protein ACO1QR_09230 [Chthoniobacteraceae bacterium]